MTSTTGIVNEVQPNRTIFLNHYNYFDFNHNNNYPNVSALL